MQPVPFLGRKEQVKQVFRENPDGSSMRGEFKVQTGKMDKAIEKCSVLYAEDTKDLQVKKNYFQRPPAVPGRHK